MYEKCTKRENLISLNLLIILLIATFNSCEKFFDTNRGVNLCGTCLVRMISNHVTF